MDFTKDAQSLYNQAIKGNYLPQELVSDCIIIAETISKMMGQQIINVCAIAESLQYCTGLGTGLPQLKQAYNKTAQATLEQLRKDDTIYHNAWCNHPGTTPKDRLIDLGHGPFESKRMAEVYAEIYQLPILKV